MDLRHVRLLRGIFGKLLLKKNIQLQLLVPMALTIGCMAPLEMSYGSEVKPKLYWKCQNKQAVRTLRIIQDQESKEWVLFYTKVGKDSEVARGRYYEFVRNIFENVKGNLIESGWDCRDITGASIIK
ncbi:MAG: hypothetical protein COT74_08255 [Bdellovibrionales bacterium CG10_big_fil_rev_8_21_14_0_10_45_34]|nr:MAG: hypothetical protein COT74_08255 [Bdellovibrionales bacterium CG10_big_fil_rev_8_21_14_0_10_45_34]